MNANNEFKSQWIREKQEPDGFLWAKEVNLESQEAITYELYLM